MSPTREVQEACAMCPNCGETPSFDGVYCFICGANSSLEHVSPAKDDRPMDYIPDDLPVRASYLFVSDGLLFSRLWYIPTMLVILTALAIAATQLGVGLMRDALVGCLACAEMFLIAWLLCTRREKDRS